MQVNNAQREYDHALIANNDDYNDYSILSIQISVRTVLHSINYRYHRHVFFSLYTIIFDSRARPMNVPSYINATCTCS